MPSMPGIRTSSRTSSGRTWSTRASASMPEDASPTVSKPGVAPITARAARWKCGWSSTVTTFTAPPSRVGAVVDTSTQAVPPAATRQWRTLVSRRGARTTAIAMPTPLRDGGEAPRMAATYGRRESSMDESVKGGGWLFFAGIMVFIAGVLNAIWGIAAIDQARFIIEDIKTWGWIILIIGVIQLVAGFSIWAGGEFGRFIGIFGATLSAIGA